MKIIVHAGFHTRTHCPVQVTFPIESIPAALWLIEEPIRQAIPCQWHVHDNQLTLSWILDALEAGTTRTYTIEESVVPLESPHVEIKALEDKVNVLIGGTLFTSYNHASKYDRPFLYPVIGPFGHGITRNYPMIADVPGETADHPHHCSLYTAFGDVNGVDNWSQETGHGRIVHQAFSSLESGPVYGRIVAQSDWQDDQGKKMFSETREMTFFNLPADARLLDYTVTFCADQAPLTLGDTKEGGLLSVRVASSMDVKQGQGGAITNAYGGLNEAETWGKRSPWCDYAGPVAGRMVGIALMDHPTNLRYPTQWHVRDYGLMAANCFAWSHYEHNPSVSGSYTIPAHSALTFRYRIYIHVGDGASVPARFIDFISPPQVRVDFTQP